MINEKKKFDCELVEWPLICRDLYQHMWMPPLTSENSHFLQSGPQEATLVMSPKVNQSSVHVLLQFPPSHKFKLNSHTTLYRKVKFNTPLGYSTSPRLPLRGCRQLVLHVLSFERTVPSGGGSATFEIVALKKKKNGVGRGQGRKKL